MAHTKRIPHPDKCLKTKIWSIAKTHRPVHSEYYVYDIAEQTGHEVVHLPAAHSELNPIEMAWSQIKHYTKTHNTKFTLSEMEWLTHIAFTAVTADHWKYVVAHVKEKDEDHYLEADDCCILSLKLILCQLDLEISLYFL